MNDTTHEQWVKHLATLLWDEVFTGNRNPGYIVVYSNGEMEVVPVEDEEE